MIANWFFSGTVQRITNRWEKLFLANPLYLLFCVRSREFVQADKLKNVSLLQAMHTSPVLGLRRIVNSLYHPFSVIPKPDVWQKREALQRFTAVRLHFYYPDPIFFLSGNTAQKEEQWRVRRGSRTNSSTISICRGLMRESWKSMWVIPLGFC